MSKLTNIILSTVLMATAARSAEVYTDARINQVEQNDNYIILFLADVEGYQPKKGNGSTNEPHPNDQKPWLYLAKGADEIASRKHMLSAALTALTIGSKVRFRWDTDGSNESKISSLLVRN